MLSSIGFTKIKRLDKSRRRSSSTWGFLATWKDAKDVVQATFTDPSEEESFEVQAVKDSKCRDDKRQIQQIRAPNRIAFDSAWNDTDRRSNSEATKTRIVIIHDENATGEEKKKDEDAPMPDAAVDSPTKAGETATKRPRLESQNSKDADKDPHTWDLAGGTRIKNDGAGGWWLCFPCGSPRPYCAQPQKDKNPSSNQSLSHVDPQKGPPEVWTAMGPHSSVCGKLTKESFASYSRHTCQGRNLGRLLRVPNPCRDLGVPSPCCNQLRWNQRI